MAVYDWMIAIGFMFGLAFILSVYTHPNLKTFLVFFTMINAFVVWAGLLPLWTLIINLLVLAIITYLEIKNRRVV